MPVLTGRIKKTGERVEIVASLDEDAYDPNDAFFSRTGNGRGKKGHVVKKYKGVLAWYPCTWVELTHIDGSRIRPEFITGGSNGKDAIRQV